MVAPYEIGDPVRSYVRVPGSGTDKTAKSLCCDLARVSSLAAAAPIPQNHVQEPPSTTSEQTARNENVIANGNATGDVDHRDVTKDDNQEVPKATANVETDVRKDNDEAEEVKEMQDSTQDTQDEQPSRNIQNPRKRTYQAEEVRSDEGYGSGSPPRKLKCTKSLAATEVSSRQDGGAQSIGGVGINTAVCEKASTSSVGIQTTESLSTVVHERDQLRQQNILLERRLSVFKDIFRNKKRLVRLLKSLEVEPIQGS